MQPATLARLGIGRLPPGLIPIVRTTARDLACNAPADASLLNRYITSVGVMGMGMVGDEY